MHRIGHLMLGLVVCLTALGGTTAGGDIRLEGDYVWHRENGNLDGTLEAVFTPAGENRWDVAFHFKFENKPHVWLGTAQGDLRSGALSGEVVSDDDEEAQFRFEGTFENGKFKGTHGQVSRNGSLRDTGTLILARAS